MRRVDAVDIILLFKHGGPACGVFPASVQFLQAFVKSKNGRGRIAWWRPDSSQSTCFRMYLIEGKCRFTHLVGISQILIPVGSEAFLYLNAPDRSKPQPFSSVLTYSSERQKNDGELVGNELQAASSRTGRDKDWGSPCSSLL